MPALTKRLAATAPVGPAPMIKTSGSGSFESMAGDFLAVRVRWNLDDSSFKSQGQTATHSLLATWQAHPQRFHQKNAPVPTDHLTVEVFMDLGYREKAAAVPAIERSRPRLFRAPASRTRQAVGLRLPRLLHS